MIAVSLEELGYTPFVSALFADLHRPDLVPARIAADGQSVWHLAGCRAATGELSGRLRHDLPAELRPAVGDWVAVADDPERAIIHHVLPRRTSLVRRGAGKSGGVQVIAANVDCFCIVTSANRDLNPRRVERYLTAVWESGANPVIVLNKVDLVDDVAPMRDELAAVALGVPIVQVSALTGDGIATLRELLPVGATVGFVGSSGVGKSSLVNRLMGRVTQEVMAIRDDDARGRHTTTRRELIPLPGGAVLMDTPGMREFGLTEDGGGVDVAFADISSVAQACRFSDCQHQGEPGCAVQEALDRGEISWERWESYRKLQREVAAYEARNDPVLASEHRRRWKVIHKAMKVHGKVTGKP